MNINILFRFSLPLFVLLLASMAPLCAQTILPIWWTAPERMALGQGMTYLPNFYQGRGALAIKHNGKGATWLNRFPNDTISVFTWKGGTEIKRADFNGDGITDYIDQGGYIYQGIKNGEPPNPEPASRIDIPTGLEYLSVIDADNDGLDDILFGHTLLKLRVARGNRDLRLIKPDSNQIIMPGAKSDEGKRITTIYKGIDKQLRIMVYTYTRNENAREKDFYDIYRIRLNNPDSSPQVIPAGRIHGESTTEKYFGYADFLAISADSQYMFVPGTNCDACKYIFDIRTDTPKINDTIPYGGGVYFFDKSVTGGTKPDFAMLYDWGNILIFRGGYPFPSQPVSKNQIFKVRPYPDNDTAGINDIVMLDDVNGDGINDIAVNSQTSRFSNIFRILLGQVPAMSIEHQVEQIFNLSDPAPHPVQYSSKLKIVIDKSDEYILRLLSIDGSRSRVLFQGQLDPGEHIIPLEIQTMPAGAAMLQLFRGSQFISSRIIILQ